MIAEIRKKCRKTRSRPYPWPGVGGMCFASFAFLLPTLLPAQAGPGVITTFAGGSIGDGGPAVQATLRAPWGLAVDTAGVIYIVDQVDHRIRRVGPNGIITTIAGTGIRGFSGDGGPATQASLSIPTGVAVDAKGNVYIADQFNHRIRRVGPDGIITTFAGTGNSFGFSGDGGPATQASLSIPTGVAVDTKGNVYIAESSRIRRVGSNGIITTFAGTETGGFSGDGGPATQARLNPEGVAVDAKGNVYVADQINHRIRRVGPDGIIMTLAGTVKDGFSGDGGPAAQAQLYLPRGIAVDATGNVYIADTFNHRIRRVGIDGIITAFSGTGRPGLSGDGGPATQAQLAAPWGVAADTKGDVYIADTGNHRIRRVGPDGIITTVAGGGRSLGDGGPAAQAQLNSPNGVAVDAKGNVYIADTDNHRIRLVGSDGIITAFAGTGTSGFSGDGGPAIQANLNLPNSVAVDATGNVYIADGLNHRIRLVGSDGIITTFAGTGTSGFSGDGGPAIQANLGFPTGVAVDAKGNVYIAESGNRIRRVEQNGIITTIAGTGTEGFAGDGGPAPPNGPLGPAGVAVDIKGNVYIAELGNRIRRVGLDGIITTIAGTGIRGFSGDGGPAAQAELWNPSGVAVDAKGVVYIADSYNNRIRRVGPDGIITTFAGTRTFGFSGDGGPAAQAELWNPSGVAVDAKGYVYIADMNNHRIRRVSPAEVSEGEILGPISLDLDLTPGDQQVRIREDVRVSQKIDVELVAVEKASGSVGFSARIEYDTLAVSYISGSFKPGTMFSGTFAPLVNAKPGFVEVGGTTLGGGSATVDKGTLGTLQFEAVKGFKGETRLILTNVVYNRGEGRRDRFELRTLVKLNVTGGLASDFDGNGAVDLGDFFALAGAFGQKAAGDSAKFDLDGDGEVGFGDFFAFAAEFGKKTR